MASVLRGACAGWGQDWLGEGGMGGGKGEDGPGGLRL